MRRGRGKSDRPRLTRICVTERPSNSADLFRLAGLLYHSSGAIPGACTGADDVDMPWLGKRAKYGILQVRQVDRSAATKCTRYSRNSTMTQSLRMIAIATGIVGSLIHPSTAQQSGNASDLKRFSVGSLKTLSKQDQERILLILRSTKLLTHQEDVSVLDGIVTRDILNDRGRELCKSTCDGSYATAQSACAEMIGAATATACYVASGAATVYCKDHC